MKKFSLFTLFSLLILFGCAPSGEEPTLPEVDPRPESVDTPVVAPVESEEMPMEEEATAAPTPAAGEAEERQTAVPVTVDLSRLTPEPAAPGDLTVIPSPGIPGPAARLVAEVKADLGRRLNIDVSEIDVVTVAEVTWRDSSLGCPQPNMNYLQVLTPGFRIVLEAEGQQYAYHSRDADHFILCRPPGLIVPPTYPEK